ncbi:hypothetical protein ACA910_002512 [Epithemia clementina (nom. ined.)]
MLGWNVDSLRMTIELPPHRRKRLTTLIADTQHKRTISVTTCHKLLGELRSMALGIPGTCGLFSHLQWALVNNRHCNTVRLNHNARDALANFATLATDIASRPTRIAEVIPTAPLFVGACDAPQSAWVVSVFRPREMPIFSPKSFGATPLPLFFTRNHYF